MKKTIRESLQSAFLKFMSLRPEVRWLTLFAVIALTVFVRQTGVSLFRNESKGNIIKIGAILPQTGPGAVFAQYIREGSELAAEEINATQTQKVRIIYEDSQNLPREAITVYNKLVATEHPPVVMVALSSVARALAPLAAESQVAQVYIAVAIPDITDGKHTFRVYPEASGMAGVMAGFTARKLKASTAAVFYVNDDFGRVSLDAYRRAFEAQGGKVVFAESYELQETNFRPQISKLKTLDPAPDVIYLSGYGPAYGVAVRQFREQEVSQQITADMTMGLPNTQEQIGSAGDNIYFVDGPVSQDFAKRFRDKYGKEPSSYAGYSYDIIHLLNHVAHTKPEFTFNSVVDGLHGVKNYPGAMGRITITPNGDSTLQFVVKKTSGGVSTVISDDQQ